MELPDIYLTRQAGAMGDAIRAGDDERAERLRRHLVAEASHDSDDARDLDQYTALAGGFARMMAARGRGDDGAADRIGRELAECFPREAIQHMLAMQLLAAGARDGSMQAEHYDTLVELLADAGLSGYAAEALAGIERRGGGPL
jgi:hypothetical protein